MGLMRKAMFIGSLGMSGLVFKDDSKKEPAGKHSAEMNGAGKIKVSAATKAAGGKSAARKKTSAKRAKPQTTAHANTQTTARANTQTTERAKTQAKAKASTGKAKRQPQAARAADPPQRAANAAPPSSGTASELERLAYLHRGGALTNQEFAAAKAKILATSPAISRSGAFPAVEANVAAARHLADLADTGHGASIGARERE